MRSMETVQQLISDEAIGSQAFNKAKVFCKAMTHILICLRIFFILGCQMASIRESQRHVLKFLARTLLTFIIESQVFCLAIFIV